MRALVGLLVGGIVGGVLLLAVLASLFATLLWYCFDDKLAEICNNPAIATVPWYKMWAFTFFVSALFKARQTNTNSNS